MTLSIADIHNHLVPGVDDGARDEVEAAAALGKLVAGGVGLVLTTPHVDASILERAARFPRFHEAIERAWQGVVERARDQELAVELFLGREIKLDTARPEVDDPRLRLNAGRFVLVEFPRLRVPPGSEDVLHYMGGRGWIPVVAHVERYGYGEARDIRLLEQWRAAGAVLQVNAPSLVGRYGPAARELGWELLERGWVDLLASDYHARGETWLDEARSALDKRGAGEQARLLLDVNPRRVVADATLEAVPPLPPRAGRWKRLVAALGGGDPRDAERA